jgi:hypothetical protein
MLTSRARVQRALAHQTPDCVPLDLAGSPVSGMHVDSVYRLRQALGLDNPGTPVKIIEPYQLLGEVKPDLMAALGVDVVGLSGPRTMFGFRNEGWKPWTTHAGTPVLVPAGFNTDPAPDGSIYLYPEGDKSLAPSGHMPPDGWYFDAIVRQPPIVEDQLNVADNLEEFALISDADLEHFRSEAERLYTETDKAILANFGGTAFGDIALVPAMWLRDPKGIRDVAEWYISTAARRDYVYAIFERQCEIALANLARIYPVVGDKITAIYVTGTDFGTQTSQFISPAAFRRLYKPFHKQINDWVHQHTPWKTFIHTDGALLPLIPEFIDAGFDIMNPVQFTAKEMELDKLKARFGDQLVFWGAGVDTQRTLPFGTPDEIRAQVRQNIATLAPNGGFVFTTVHNVQPQTPVENLLALYQAFADYRTA